MKKLLLIALIPLYSAFSHAATITAIATSGDWTSNSTWDLNRVPQDNDVIIIPAGKTVIITTVLSYNTIYISINGTLKFSGGKITMSTSSTVYVYGGGKIKGSGSPSEQLRLGGKIWDGSNPDISGPEMADGSTGAFVPFTTLPVKFEAFTVSRVSNDVLVQWSTSQEINAGSYEVDRSYDASAWIGIATVKAIGTTNAISNYSYTDKNNTATVIYYRIRQTDNNGQFTYTSVKSVKNERNNDIKIASVQNKILLLFPQQVKGAVMIRVVAMSGQVMEQQTVNGANGQIILNTKCKGNYIVSVTNGQELSVAAHLIL
jgi:hypothetical protein